jgi:hypothetical protein
MLPALTATYDMTDNQRTLNNRSAAGNWEIHSRGRADLPGMAVISAITALQVGATLAKAAADQIALTKAAEYLTNVLAAQLKSFQQTLATGGSRVSK